MSLGYDDHKPDRFPNKPDVRSDEQAGPEHIVQEKWIVGKLRLGEKPRL